MKIIDTHVHIFPQKIAQKATQSLGDFYGEKSLGSGIIEDLLASGKKIGVYKFIVHSPATSCRQVESINNFLLQTIQQNDRLTGLIAMHPDETAEEIERDIAFAQKNNFKGIKLHPDFQRFAIDEERAEKIYQAVQGKLSILFHAGDPRYQFSNPERIYNIAKKYPKLKIIAAHFGGWSEWEKVEIYKDCPNVYFDTSSSLEFITPKRAREIIDALGVHRFMFGSDYPMWEHGRVFELLKNVKLTHTELEMILSKNAEGFYSL